MSESFPDLPLLKTLRLAKPSDILRIGIVATASFRYSPVFRWERPYHEKFPQATLLAYRKEFTNALKNEQSVVLVVDDSFIPNESDFTEAIIPADNGWSAPATGDKVVVGAMSFKFEPGSLRQGQFSFNDGM
ncbi:hypothetical protein N7456_007608 [Penicillium angulare]|uniref:Uncharacterized protein n=1 Tax=Penicillium angulare TaxID=116970 RepID=A0A9W9K9F3_9EURO|nr:hypothetical protein N7456_007608 [Penicillium angulare]